MAVTLATLAALVTYYAVYKVFFEDRDEFFEKLKGTFYVFPISLLLDYPSGRESIRIWVWLLSGFAVGVIVFAQFR